MAEKRHSAGEIINLLREAESLLSQEEPAGRAARHNCIRFNLVAGYVAVEYIGGERRPTSLSGGTALLWLQEDGITHVP